MSCMVANQVVGSSLAVAVASPSASRTQRNWSSCVGFGPWPRRCVLPGVNAGRARRLFWCWVFIVHSPLRFASSMLNETDRRVLGSGLGVAVASCPAWTTGGPVGCFGSEFSLWPRRCGSLQACSTKPLRFARCGSLQACYVHAANWDPWAPGILKFSMTSKRRKISIRFKWRFHSFGQFGYGCIGLAQIIKNHMESWKIIWNHRKS